MKINPVHAPANTADLHLSQPVITPDRQIEFGCRLVESSGEDRYLWFRFPSEYGPLLTRKADPFVLAVLTYAMGRISHVHVHGAVSDGLFANLAEFQKAFAAFQRLRVAPVTFSATAITTPPGGARAMDGITAFSGGVDSCFSAYMHSALSASTPKRPIRAALMIHGFDIPLEQTTEFARSAARSADLAREAGLRLFTGATNLRTLPVLWERTFATNVAACLAFFQPAYAFALIPSFHDYANTDCRHGSNPITDPMLSSASFQIYHDGAGFGRIDKLRHLAQGWSGALRNLRVCWQSDLYDRNCCRCEKCIRTILMLRVCGVTQTEAFPLPVTERELSTLVIKGIGGLGEFVYLVDEAKRQGIDEPWVKHAERVIVRSKRYMWLRNVVRSFGWSGRTRDAVRKAGAVWFRQSAASRPVAVRVTRPEAEPAATH